MFLNFHRAILRLKYLLGLIEARQVPRDFLREVTPFLLGNVRTREQVWFLLCCCSWLS